jgi:hypothetical protein
MSFDEYATKYGIATQDQMIAALQAYERSRIADALEGLVAFLNKVDNREMERKR